MHVGSFDSFEFLIIIKLILSFDNAFHCAAAVVCICLRPLVGANLVVSFLDHPVIAGSCVDTFKIRKIALYSALLRVMIKNYLV